MSRQAQGRSNQASTRQKQSGKHKAEAINRVDCNYFSFDTEQIQANTCQGKQGRNNKQSSYDNTF